MMALKTDNQRRMMLYALLLLSAPIMGLVLAAAGIADDTARVQKGYASAEEAVRAWIAAIKSDNDQEVLAIFGPDAKEVIFSGDPVSDRERREGFINDFDKQNSLSQEGDKMVLIVGENDWPFPIPLVKEGDQWFFDTQAGKEEILNRRVGENELSTIQTMLAIVDAEREYAMKYPDNDRVLEYAGKFRSDPGKKNGLYWKTEEGEDESPLGELVADARDEGYTKADVQKKSVPFHGYYFRMLYKQGEHAPGGAFEYVVNGKQIGGFAVVAYPAEYGNSGVMTFLVNHDGTVYQKDLGTNTAENAKAMVAFDPDSGWKKVE